MIDTEEQVKTPPTVPPPATPPVGIKSHMRSPEEVEELRRKYLEGIRWG